MSNVDAEGVFLACRHCGAAGLPEIEIVEFGRAKHFKACCGSCGAYIRFLPHTNYICPRCGSRLKHLYNPRRALHFWGCSNHPECRFTVADVDGKPDFKETQHEQSGPHSL